MVERYVPLSLAVSLEQDVFSKIGHLPVADIDEALVLQVLEPIWKKKTKTARDIRARIAKVLGYAAAKGYRPRGPNPAAWRDYLEHSLPKPSSIAQLKPHPALPYKEVGAFMAELRKNKWIAARALEFLILCASRTGEVRFAKWSEIDWHNRLWIIPKARMKMRRNGWCPDHVVPLCDTAMAVLKALKGGGESDPNGYIFAGRTGPVADNGLMIACWRIHEDITVHGFRSSEIGPMLRRRCGNSASPTLSAASIPVVFATVGDPIGSGFVASLARPGGNVTGFTTVEGPLGGKYLEILKEIAPRVTRVSAMFNPAAAPYVGNFINSFKTAAQSLGVTTSAAAVQDASEIEPVVSALARESNGGLAVMPDSFTLAHRVEVTSLAARQSAACCPTALT